MQYLTIADIARVLNISQSTCRFYRDKYSDYLPSVGSGRARRYEDEAVEVLKIIVDGYKEKQPSAAIESRLQQRFGIPQQSTTESKQQTTAIERNENLPENQVFALVVEQQKMLREMAATISNLQQEVQQLKESTDEQISEVAQEVQQQVQQIDRKIQQQDLERNIAEDELKRELDERDKRLMERMVKEIKDSKKKSIFQKLFGKD